jgi:hypothetical protein
MRFFFLQKLIFSFIEEKNIGDKETGDKMTGDKVIGGQNDQGTK